MIADKKPQWCNWMIMANSLEQAKNETPKAEWDDLREYIEMSAYRELERELTTLRDDFKYLDKAFDQRTKSKKALEARIEKLETMIKRHMDRMKLGNHTPIGEWKEVLAADDKAKAGET